MYETKEPNKVSSAKPNSRSKRCVQRLVFKRRTCPASAGGNVSDIYSIL